MHNRKQKVVLSGSESPSLPVNAGVPQGSILGPLLFLVFINDIEEHLTSNVSLFADDCTLIKEYKNNTEAETCLNSDLEAISNWAKHWHVTFNTTKTVYMTFSNKKFKTPLNIVFGEPINAVKDHKHLGLLFSDDLKWTKHIHSIGNTALQKIGLLFRLRAYLSRKQMETIYLCVIRPALEYCAIIYDNSNVADMLFLDNVQRKAALVCTGALRRTHNYDLFKEVGWESLGIRRKVSKLYWFYKIYVLHSPGYLFNLVSSNIVFKNVNAIVTRSSNTGTHRLINTRCRTTKYYKSYFPCCIRSWNCLKFDLSSVLSLNQVKMELNKLFMPECSDVELSRDYVYCSTGRISKLITQFRVGLSPLRNSLFSYCIIDNPFCAVCGECVETLEYIFIFFFYFFFPNQTIQLS